jgi:hypothetical protein
MNYPIISLLKVKVTLNLNLNYIIIKNTKVHQYRILNYYFYHYLYYYLYKNTTHHDMCHHVFMYYGRDKNTNLQTNGSSKYISNTYGGVMQNET